MENEVRTRLLRDMGLTPWVCRTLPEPAPQSGEPGARIMEPPAAPPSVAADWSGLEAAVSACTRCVLAQGRTRTVFGVGARDARWMFVGEGPGAEEDKRGEPFVGRAGKLLDAMLAAFGLARAEVYITNVVKCRPPGNRNPLPEEAEACWPYLERQIKWVNPALIIALGAVAARRLLGTEAPVGHLRGRVHKGPHGCPVIVTYHPAYLLRTPQAKRKGWEDLRLALATAAPRVS